MEKKLYYALIMIGSFLVIASATYLTILGISTIQVPWLRSVVSTLVGSVFISVGLLILKGKIQILSFPE